MTNVLDRPTEPPDAVLRYAAHADGLIDVYLPDGGGAHPLLVLLHGGFWRTRWDRRHLRPLAYAMMELGVVVACPEYRRGDESWPAMREDVRAVVSGAADLLDGIGVPTSGTTVAGHSAGGQLALWAANEHLDLDRVVGLAPVADLAYARAHHLGDDAVRDLLAGETGADPRERLVTRPKMPVTIVHGTEDVQVPVASSRGLVAALPWIDYRELDGVDHFALIDPLSEAWPEVRAALIPPPG
ncbi:MAG: alpha/beta hydrolase [Nocardioidaceae bacterium]